MDSQSSQAVTLGPGIGQLLKVATLGNAGSLGDKLLFRALGLLPGMNYSGKLSGRVFLFLQKDGLIQQECWDLTFLFRDMPKPPFWPCQSGLGHDPGGWVAPMGQRQLPYVGHPHWRTRGCLSCL